MANPKDEGGGGKVVNMKGDKKGDPKPTPFDYDRAEHFAKLIEAQQAIINEEKEASAKRTAPNREKVADLYKQAGQEDVGRKVLKHVLAKRSAARKQRRAFEKLSEEHQAQSTQLELRLNERDEVPAEAAAE